MSDNLGPNQTRVLDSSNRSFESVIYQRKKPPLSCEVNLTGNLAVGHAQDVFRSTTPSGWTVVGNIRDNFSENQMRTGEVLCSYSLPRNTIKLMANNLGLEADTLTAWVNGEKLLVQGTNLTNSLNNLISLPEPPSSSTNINFVFLEVWRKLITPEDNPYPKYGNILYGGSDNFVNDLIDPSMGIETSLRIQVQYRIRVVTNVDIETYPDGFDPNMVFVQGPLSNPISTCDHAYFSLVPGDPGLWRAGVGDTAAQEQLETVDGFTYAIPMFAIARRNSGTYSPELRANGSGKTLANYLAGIASDRPDNKYNDWITADDVLDMRFKIGSTHPKEVCEDAFSKLLNGNYFTKMGKSQIGETSFGPVVIQTDGITSDSPSWASQIAYPDGKRRVFSNATATQAYTIDKTTASSPWIVGNTIRLESKFPRYPVGTTISSLNDSYSNKTTSTLNPLNLGGVTAVVGGFTGNIYTNNGDPSSLNWVLQPNDSTEIVLSVGWCHNRFIGVSTQGRIMRSNPVGGAWTDATILSGVSFGDIASNSVAIVSVGANSRIFRSTNDGANWTAATTIAAGEYNGIASSTNYFVAVGDDGASNGIIAHSNDGGNNWSYASTVPSSFSLRKVAWNGASGAGSRFVAVGDGGYVLYSNLGSVDVWNLATVPNTNFRGIAWSPVLNLFVMVGDTDTTSPALYSPDGIAWSQGGGDSTFASANFQSVAWVGGQHNKFIAAEALIGTLYTSSNGINWTADASPIMFPTDIVWGETAEVSGTGTDTVTVEIKNADGLASDPLYFEYTISYPTGPNGLTALPEQMLSFRQELSGSPYIATTDADLRDRKSVV